MLVNIKTAEGGSTSPSGRVNNPDLEITITATPNPDYAFYRWDVTSVCIADMPEWCPPLVEFISSDNPLTFGSGFSLEFTVTPLFRLIVEPPEKPRSLIWFLMQIGIGLGLIYLGSS